MAEDKPFDYVVRTAVEAGEDKTRWREIGVGFKGRESITCLVDAVPVNGKFIIFPYTPKEPKQPTFSEELL